MKNDLLFDVCKFLVTDEILFSLKLLTLLTFLVMFVPHLVEFLFIDPFWFVLCSLILFLANRILLKCFVYPR